MSKAKPNMPPDLNECACEAINTCLSDGECVFAIPAVSLTTFNATLTNFCAKRKAKLEQWKKDHPNVKDGGRKHGRRSGPAELQPRRAAADLLPLLPPPAVGAPPAPPPGAPPPAGPPAPAGWMPSVVRRWVKREAAVAQAVEALDEEEAGN
jgi:hypothetical protein